MSKLGIVRAAAQNNAEWCDAFCRTYGIGGLFRGDCWWSPVRTPPLYPDAVTLVPNVDVGRLLSGIDTSEGCSVKDSFADMDLTGSGFAELFRADWLVRPTDEAPPSVARAWVVLTREEQLREWESMWAAPDDASGFFRTALLADDAVAVLARYEAGRITAGAVANRSPTAIGLSNLFDVEGDRESAWYGAAATASAVWQPLPVVSYDWGASLDAAHEAGFHSIGELCVWASSS
jgi:hypothetical protein